MEETYHERVRRVLNGQDGPLIDGQRTILCSCKVCDRYWLLQGQHAQLHLNDQEVQMWARRLHADISRLPPISCRSCLTRFVGGELSIDEYADAAQNRIWGYGYSWEALSPAQHLLVSVLNLQQMRRSQFDQPAYQVVTQPALARDVLIWLAHNTRQPVVYNPLSPADLEATARANTPGAAAPGTTDWVWRGARWEGSCPVLNGPVVVLLAQAGSPHARFTLTGALREWRAVTERALRFGIGLVGEEMNTDE